jgi:aspartate aminotransferase
MTRVSARLGAISESATMAISNRANEMRAAGRNVISFGAGEPDYETPPHIVEAAIEAARDPRNHKYSANAGLPALREAIALRTSQDDGLEVTPSQVLVTNGGKQAVFQTLAAMVDPGEEVIVPAPYWVTYPEAVKLAGGVPVIVPTTTAVLVQGHGRTVGRCLDPAYEGAHVRLAFESDRRDLRPRRDPGDRTVGSRTRRVGALQMTSTSTWSMATRPFTSLPGVTPEFEDRWVIIHGVSKTYAMTGWRVGWMIGPKDVITAAANHQSHATSNVSNISQRAALAALTGPTEPIESMRQGFDRGDARRCTRCSKVMNGVECAEPLGAFYCFPSFRRSRSQRTDSTRLLALCAGRSRRPRLRWCPGEAFGAPGYARLSYALSDDDLVEGLDRLKHFLD